MMDVMQESKILFMNITLACCKATVSSTIRILMCFIEAIANLNDFHAKLSH